MTLREPLPPANAPRVRLTDLVPDAQIEFDIAELELNITGPQASMVQAPYGYVSPALWDAGIKAGLSSTTSVPIAPINLAPT